MIRLLLLALLILAVSRPSATDLPAGAWQRIEPDHSRTTAAPRAALRVPSLPAIGKRAALVGTQPAAEPPAAQLSGVASWVNAGLGPRYLAARMPKGTILRVCGELGCVTRTVNDYGPNKRKHPERIVDVSRADFARICGDPDTLGTCPVRVTIAVAPAMPATDTE